MPLLPYVKIDETMVAQAIKDGELRLEYILQNVFEDDGAAEKLGLDIDPLGGTARAGREAHVFAEAMMKA
jgi:hypothetical protein